MSESPDQYRYASDVPADVILDWIVAMAWDEVRDDGGNEVEILRFIPMSSPEDSGFCAMPDRYKNDSYKASVKQAVFLAYKQFVTEKTAQRRAQYEELKKEFECPK